MKFRNHPSARVYSMLVNHGYATGNRHLSACIYRYITFYVWVFIYYVRYLSVRFSKIVDFRLFV